MKGKTHAEAAVIRESMKAYKQEGHTIKEVAAAFGYSEHYTQIVCKGIAPQTDRKPMNYRNQYTNGEFDREANAIRCIDERTPWFEYAGDFSGMDGYVSLKCKQCGTIVKRSMIAVRHGKVKCDVCEQQRREVNHRHKQKIREQKENERNRARWLQSERQQIGFVSCKCCGSLFLPNRKNRQYCSGKCGRKVNDAIKKDRRIRKVKSVIVDRAITLQELSKRDGGICQLCGCVCEWDDFIQEYGVFIAGDKYPSIDHIKPLSKGGLHSWDNVQLACRKCNSLKSDKI